MPISGSASGGHLEVVLTIVRPRSVAPAPQPATQADTRSGPFSIGCVKANILSKLSIFSQLFPSHERENSVPCPSASSRPPTIT